MRPSYEDFRKIFDEMEHRGQPSVYDHEWVKLCIEKIDELQPLATPITDYQCAVNLLQTLANWFRDNNHSHYFAVDTKIVNEDHVPITCIMHTLHLDSQFAALHHYVETSRQNMKEKPLEADDEN